MKRGRGRGKVRAEHSIDRRRRSGGLRNAPQDQAATAAELLPSYRFDRFKNSPPREDSSSKECSTNPLVSDVQFLRPFDPEPYIWSKATFRCKSSVLYRHYKYTKGDIINIKDKITRKPYFAQIRGIVVDPDLQPYAAITWLAPKPTCIDPHDFLPDQFVHSFADKKMYSLKFFNWVSGRPCLPSYICDFSERKVVTDNIIRILKERLKDIADTTQEEFECLKPLPARLSSRFDMLSAAAAASSITISSTPILPTAIPSTSATTFTAPIVSAPAASVLTFSELTVPASATSDPTASAPALNPTLAPAMTPVLPVPFAAVSVPAIVPALASTSSAPTASAIITEPTVAPTSTSALTPTISIAPTTSSAPVASTPTLEPSAASRLTPALTPTISIAPIHALAPAITSTLPHAPLGGPEIIVIDSESTS
ncbi:unnamed protein product [Auanema sp. JU1783]|nr:unnamed protein product [Auanema sp. JU1783]